MSTLLNTRRHPDAEAARERFADATRSATFSLALGVWEIRMLQARPWGDAWAMQARELATLQKLIDKGLVEHVQGSNPHLSAAGELVCQLLALSRHITVPEVDPGPDYFLLEPGERMHAGDEVTFVNCPPHWQPISPTWFNDRVCFGQIIRRPDVRRN